jgi:hypothetical protein
MVTGWIGGELLGGFVGGFISGATGDGSERSMATVYICALVGAAIGAVMVFSLANALGSKDAPPSLSSSPSAYAPPTMTPRCETGNPYQSPS